VIVNGLSHDAPAPIDVASLLADLGIEPRGVAVAINGEIVRRSSWEATLVRAGDVVEVVTAVAGG
jgi:sulfur carrier protein